MQTLNVHFALVFVFLLGVLTLVNLLIINSHPCCFCFALNISRNETLTLTEIIFICLLNAFELENVRVLNCYTCTGTYIVQYFTNFYFILISMWIYQFPPSVNWPSVCISLWNESPLLLTDKPSGFRSVRAPDAVAPSQSKPAQENMHCGDCNMLVT